MDFSHVSSFLSFLVLAFLVGWLVVGSAVAVLWRENKMGELVFGFWGCGFESWEGELTRFEWFESLVEERRLVVVVMEMFVSQVMDG